MVRDSDGRRIPLVKRGNPSADRLEIGLPTEKSVQLCESALEQRVEEIGRCERKVDRIFGGEFLDKGIRLGSSTGAPY